MKPVGDGFALFDRDDGGAVVLSSFRRRIHFDHRITLQALELVFAEPEAALAAFLAHQQSVFSKSQRSASIAELQTLLDAEAYFRIYDHPLALYARLRQRQTVCYGALVSVPGDEALLFLFTRTFF